MRTKIASKRTVGEPKRGDMTTSVNQNRLPPYVSYRSWLKILDRITTFLPGKVDSSFLSDLEFSVSTAKKMRTALLFLGLIDGDNVPSEKLQRLHRSLQGFGQETQVVILRDILHTAYPSLFTQDFDLERATPGQLRELFERMGVRGRIQRYCISFFLQMAIDAEINISPLLTTRSKLGTGRKSDALKSRERRRKLLTQQSKGTQLRGDEGFDWSKLHPAILALLKDLAARGASWDAQEKAKFQKAFEAVFDIAYPNDRHGSE